MLQIKNLMKNRIYLTGIEKKPGKSFVTIGLLALLMEQQQKLNCFKLFGEDDEVHVALLEEISKQKITHLMGISKAISLMNNASDKLIADAIEKVNSSDNSLMSFFEGSDFESDNDVVEYQFNLNLAYQLKCEVVLVVSAKGRTMLHLTSLIKNALEMSKKNHASVVGIIINQISTGMEAKARERLKKIFPDIPYLCVIPEFEQLANPTVHEIAQKLNAHILYGDEALKRPVKQYTVAAKTVSNFLKSRMDRSGMLIITPDDRIDILLGSLLADQSINYPKIAGIVLTGGKKPDKVIQSIISGLENTLPVLLTRLKTYETVTTLYSAKYSLHDADQEKVREAIESMHPFLLQDIDKLRVEGADIKMFSPAIFLYDLMYKAKQTKAHIVLPEGYDHRILEAADYILRRKLLKITLLGHKEFILKKAKKLNLSLPGVHIIDLEEAQELKEKYATEYQKLRAHKNVNYPIALERMSDPNFFAVMMVYFKDADGMVSGAQHTTADTVRPALEIIKTQEGVSKVSSIFIMCLDTKVMLYGDCAINPEPDAKTLAEIASQAATMSKMLDIEPKVAMLSYSSGQSGTGSAVEKVREATKLIQQQNPDFIIEGPIQYDAAVDPGVAAKKMPGSKLAGEANVLIFPDLNTGNNTYKAVQRESGAIAIGPILLGLKHPINDLSRGCSAKDVINTILITAIQTKNQHS